MIISIQECLRYLVNGDRSAVTDASWYKTQHIDHFGNKVRFKSYYDEIFKNIREDHYNIDCQAYVNGITNEPCFTFPVNSKGGGFFYYSNDKHYIIKTISKHQSKILRSMLQRYYSHITNNKNTLIIPILGLYRIKLAK